MVVVIFKDGTFESRRRAVTCRTRAGDVICLDNHGREVARFPRDAVLGHDSTIARAMQRLVSIHFD